MAMLTPALFEKRVGHLANLILIGVCRRGLLRTPLLGCCSPVCHLALLVVTPLVSRVSHGNGPVWPWYMTFVIFPDFPGFSRPPRIIGRVGAGDPGRRAGSCPGWNAPILPAEIGSF